MGENASASFEEVIIDEVGAATVNGSGGEAKVGYFTDVSWRKISMSKGVDLILTPGGGTSALTSRTDESERLHEPPSVIGGNPATSRASFLTL